MRPLANFSQSIGSRLKQSFAHINTSTTPVESINGTQPLLEDEVKDKSKIRRNAIIAGTSVALGTSLLALLLIGGALLATNSSKCLLSPLDNYTTFVRDSPQDTIFT